MIKQENWYSDDIPMCSGAAVNRTWRLLDWSKLGRYRRLLGESAGRVTKTRDTHHVTRIQLVTSSYIGKQNVPMRTHGQQWGNRLNSHGKRRKSCPEGAMESGPGATLVSCRHPRGLPKVSLQKYKPFLAISYGFMSFHTMMSLNLSALDLLLRNRKQPSKNSTRIHFDASQPKVTFALFDFVCLSRNHKSGLCLCYLNSNQNTSNNTNQQEDITVSLGIWIAIVFPDNNMLNSCSLGRVFGKPFPKSSTRGWSEMKRW